MNVLMISPGYPAEMTYFTRGLAEAGATVIGLGDQSAASLPEIARASVSRHLPVRSLADEANVMRRVAEFAGGTRIDRVECLWEPFMILAARLREMLELPGPTVDQTLPFRDKEVMKDVLGGAGVRTPRHGRATSSAECREDRRARRLPAYREARRRRRLGRHPPGRFGAGAGADPPRAPARPAGHGRGVHRGRRHDLRHGHGWRRRRALQHLPLLAPHARVEDARVAQPHHVRAARRRGG